MYNKEKKNNIIEIIKSQSKKRHSNITMIIKKKDKNIIMFTGLYMLISIKKREKKIIV